MFTSEIREKRFIGQYVMVIDISKYIDIQLFKQLLQSMVDRIRVVEPLDNSPVMVPGDPEKLSTVERIQNGIPIDEFRYKEYLKINLISPNIPYI
jgi:LDH2 family malate/lactate/ureidoglycolate dehydrogenase